jgi:CBS domain-containing protein
MKTIQQLLGDKPRTPLTVKPTDSVLVGLEAMAKADVGALLVMEGDRLLGLFSERDYARKIVLQGKVSRDTSVQEVMKENVCYVEPHQTVDEAMALMTDKRVRYLPVLTDQKKVIGIISIGDLVKETIADQAFVIQQLEHYIAS